MERPVSGGLLPPGPLRGPRAAERPHGSWEGGLCDGPRFPVPTDTGAKSLTSEVVDSRPAVASGYRCQYSQLDLAQQGKGRGCARGQRAGLWQHQEEVQQEGPPEDYG